MQRRTELKRTALARTTGFKPRTAPLARQSRAHRQQQVGQRGAYSKAADAGQVHCSVCGVTGQRLEHSHLLTQKHYPQYRANELNWLKKCAECHSLFEHNKRRFAAYYPTAWLLILLRIEKLDPVAYEQFRMKNPY